MAKVAAGRSITVGLTAFTEQIDLPLVMSQGIHLHDAYTVIDADIGAGENAQGHLEEMSIDADNEKIFDVRTDELQDLIAMLSAGVKIPGSLFTDATPTTAELQRAHYFVPFVHDFSVYKRVTMTLKYRAATSEWGGASAYSGTVKVFLEAGPVRESMIVERVPKSSATQHDFMITKNPVGRLMIRGASANTATRLELIGSDGNRDVDLVDHMMMSEAYHRWQNAAASDDTDTTIGVDGFVIQSHGRAESQVRLTLSSAAAVTAFLLKQKHIVIPEGTVGEKARGRGRRTVVDLDMAKYVSMK